MNKHLFAMLLLSTTGVIAGWLAPIQLSAQTPPAIQSKAAAPGGADANLVWGGQHIAITFGASGAEIEFDCASGTIPAPLKMDPQGKFQAEGTYKREHGGPVMKDEPGAVPAKYSGTITGDTMHLDVVLAQSKEDVGSYVLTRGQPGRVFKCR